MSDSTSTAQISVSVTVLKQLFLYMNSLGVNSDPFLGSLGIDPATIKAPDTYIPIDTYLLIQDEAAHYTNDPYFGLHMGEYAEAGSWSILGYLMMNCKTLGEAFGKSARYSRIVGNMIEGSVKFRFNKIRAILDTPPHAPKMTRHCFEATISSSLRMMRTLTGVHLSPLEVRFAYPEPESTVEYERIFCCPVKFEQKENSFTIPLSYVNTPIPMANPGLLAHFEKYAQDVIFEMDRQDEYTR
ncbi:MAG: AraC family transcriptional regulator, partial [Chloroflexi bacterium]